MTTYSGRVVYDRKEHSFRQKDILRILERTKVSTTFDEEEDLWAILNQALLSIMEYHQFKMEAAAKKILKLVGEMVINWLIGRILF